ncbi:MAG: RNA-binding protein [Paraglaciecola sp.]|uniref:RNA recognition motif domain-containing protein n=1 Tax=Paraglaciecola sp. TaxID=1920173 RepID=UPI00273E3396|nr:RNA-binding protein [Paraglaciecola sp.]MDP5030186.1 RNA-binding protein [Paraglaciecola sp.]MDP5040705.1 RNA-binding protein [Paraglaciecola sp.]MDP5131235.1 RNA-binding protein [Paraglaciecola sp.]
MNSSLITNIISVLVLAIASYFVFNSFNIALSPAISVALGIIIGGIATVLLTQLKSASTGVETAHVSELSTLYVGNLPYRANEQAVQEHFELHGVVNSVRLMKDRRTGKRKGYGFVEMDAKGADKAIKNLNDSVFQERTLKVRLAKDKTEEE